MKIDEAIEILSTLEARSINNSAMFKKDALQLGIEALIRVRDDRVTSYQPVWYPLPHETKE